MNQVKNLRLEIGNKEKQFRAQLSDKDAIIEDLRRQLTGKQSEIDFQVRKLSELRKVIFAQNFHFIFSWFVEN